MRNHADGIRGFHHFSKAWYGKDRQPTPGIVDNVMVGIYHRDGGTSGEFAVDWVLLGGKPIPQLCVFDDAWSAMALFQGLFAKMAEVDGKNISPDEFCELLKSCGIEDMTQRSAHQ